MVRSTSRRSRSAGPEPTRETFFDFATDGFYSQRWTFTEHSGTHMDAPIHFAEEKISAAEVPLTNMHRAEILDGRALGASHWLVLLGYTAGLGLLVVWRHRVEDAHGVA